MNCFICNKELVENVTDDSKQCKTHSEHIIQNALRGKITSRNILCEKCGNTLNSEIDKDFIKYFSPINEIFKNNIIKKDHGKKNNPVSVIGKIIDGNAYSENNVNYKDGTISPENPFEKIDYTAKKVKIYANKKIIKNYEKKVRKEISDSGYNPDDFSYEITDEYTDKVFIPYFGINIKNLGEAIKLGFIKIAVEFALDKGIKRTDLNRAVEIDSNGKGKIIYSKNITPYFSNSIVETLYEQFRSIVESNYPSHTLILFTTGGDNGKYILYCYIELYSTFQYYIILNHHYHEPVNITHHQNIIKDFILDPVPEFCLNDSIKKSYKKISNSYTEEEPLDALEVTINNQIKSMGENEKKALEKELDILEDAIINQKMRQADISVEEDYDLTWFHKKYFLNILSFKLESTPDFISKATILSEEYTENREKTYRLKKINDLVMHMEVINKTFKNV